MKCEDFRRLLDGFIDNELSDSELNELQAHARECDQCAEEMAAAIAMKDLLSGMDDDIAVPLETQAAWRKAVRAEAAKTKNRRVMRRVYAAAAALVIFVGCGAALKVAGPQKNVPMADMSISTSDVPLGAFEGSAEAPVFAASETAMEEAVELTVAADSASVSKSAGFDHERKYIVTDISEALASVSELAEEYGAETVSTETGASSAQIILRVDRADADPLLKACSHLGCETVNTNGSPDSGIVTIRINISLE